ncbi:MAG: hypothetical protein LBB86_00330 [Oscillospiraceae bacterium]|jgi:hypothetical protein|nr:hypothetical protein [Oscillospiraceae bacterium]
MKKVALILVLTLGLFGIGGCTTGENPPAPSASPEVSPEMTGEPVGSGGAAVRQTYMGVVGSIEQDNVSLKETGGDAVTIVITVTDETLILDGQTGAALAIDALKQGEAVIAVTRPIAAQSMPPQSPGLAIFANLPEDGVSPTYAVIKEVSVDAENQTWIVTDLDVNWRISAETPLIPYKAGAPVTMDQLTPGLQVVGWYAITTKSLPAQATPDKVLILPAVE